MEDDLIEYRTRETSSVTPGLLCALLSTFFFGVGRVVGALDSGSGFIGSVIFHDVAHISLI